MFVVTKKEGERIEIGKDIVLTLEAVEDDRVRFCIDVPEHIRDPQEQPRLPRVAAELFSLFDRWMRTPFRSRSSSSPDHEISRG